MKAQAQGTAVRQVQDGLSSLDRWALFSPVVASPGAEAQGPQFESPGFLPSKDTGAAWILFSELHTGQG